MQRIDWNRIFIALAWALLIGAFFAPVMTGCTSTRSKSASVETVSGVQNGHPVELRTLRREEASAQTQLDIGPLVQAAVAAATGDIRQAVTALASRPTVGTDDIEAVVRNAMPDDGPISPEAAGAGTAAILAALMAWMQSREKERQRKDADDAWNELAKRKTEA